MVAATTADPKPASPWAGFKPGLWQKEINVRDFIQQNYTPYDGDESTRPSTINCRIWSRPPTI